MSRPPSHTRRLLPALLCALAVPLCVWATHPAMEMSFLDDFSYIWSARVLAETGHLAYNGWATAMLGWQLYLGALFIKLFGFSFTVVHASTLPVAMAAAALMQRVFVRLGIGDWNATLATLSITLSPLFLPLAFSFMSDVPGIFCLMLCLYACLRAIQASSDRAALSWLAFAALSNALGGTARQITWLGVLVLVPATAWIIRRRPRALLVGGALWLVSAVFILGCMHWFKQQPYAVIEPLHGLRASIRIVLRNALMALFYTLPVLVAFLASYPWKERWARLQAGGAAVLLLLGGLVIARLLPRLDLLAPFSHDWWTEKGIVFPSIIGSQPDMYPTWARALLTLLTFAALFAFLIRLARAARHHAPGDSPASVLPVRTLVVLLGPFTLAYLGLVVTREHIFDRYYVPLIFVALALLMRFYQANVAPRLPLASVAAMLFFAACGVVGMHDLLAMQRARLEAANELIAAGVPRNEIKAGFDYDGWTELELTGYINDYRIKLPVGAYREPVPPNLPPECISWFTRDTPAIHGRYELSHEPLPCLPLSQFAPVPFTTWLGPRRQSIYILKLPE